jgi:hypothetical protein
MKIGDVNIQLVMTFKHFVAGFNALKFTIFKH